MTAVDKILSKLRTLALTTHAHGTQDTPKNIYTTRLQRPRANDLEIMKVYRTSGRKSLHNQTVTPPGE